MNEKISPLTKERLQKGFLSLQLGNFFVYVTEKFVEGLQCPICHSGLRHIGGYGDFYTYLCSECDLLLEVGEYCGKPQSIRVAKRKSVRQTLFGGIILKNFIKINRFLRKHREERLEIIEDFEVKEKEE